MLICICLKVKVDQHKLKKETLGSNKELIKNEEALKVDFNTYSCR